MDVWGRKFERELMALRKEFEEQQVAMSKVVVGVANQVGMERSRSLEGVVEGEREGALGEAEGSEGRSV